MLECIQTNLLGTNTIINSTTDKADETKETRETNQANTLIYLEILVQLRSQIKSLMKLDMGKYKYVFSLIKKTKSVCKHLLNIVIDKL